MLGWGWWSGEETIDEVADGDRYGTGMLVGEPVSEMVAVAAAVAVVAEVVACIAGGGGGGGSYCTKNCLTIMIQTTLNDEWARNIWPA